MLDEPLIVLQSFDLELFDLSDIAKIFAECLKKSDLLLLSGKIGAGKTEFARLIIKAKATKENLVIEEVASPTFSLTHSYEFQNCKISHMWTVFILRIQNWFQMLKKLKIYPSKKPMNWQILGPIY